MARPRFLENAVSFRRGLSSITANSTSESILAGTVPSHLCYILLHTLQPPAKYPSRKSSAVQRALQLRVSKWGGIVNFSWSPDQPRYRSSNSSEEEEPNVYSATAFSVSQGQLDIPELSLSNMDDVEARLRDHAQPDAKRRASIQNPEGVHLYVCTHGARDCRCGDIGGRVVRALREELEKRRQNDPRLGHMKIGEVGHVGGHKHAANLLVFPHGEWLGNLRPDNVPEVMDAILNRAAGSEAPLCPPHWRGRMGLTKDAQLQLLR